MLFLAAAILFAFGSWRLLRLIPNGPFGLIIGGCIFSLCLAGSLGLLAGAIYHAMV